MERLGDLIRWILLPGDTKDKSSVMVYGVWVLKILFLLASTQNFWPRIPAIELPVQSDNSSGALIGALVGIGGGTPEPKIVPIHDLNHVVWGLPPVEYGDSFLIVPNPKITALPAVVTPTSFVEYPGQP